MLFTPVLRLFGELLFGYDILPELTLFLLASGKKEAVVA